VQSIARQQAYESEVAARKAKLEDDEKVAQEAASLMPKKVPPIRLRFTPKQLAVLSDLDHADEFLDKLAVRYGPDCIIGPGLCPDKAVLCEVDV